MDYFYWKSGFTSSFSVFFCFVLFFFPSFFPPACRMVILVSCFQSYLTLFLVKSIFCTVCPLGCLLYTFFSLDLLCQFLFCKYFSLLLVQKPISFPVTMAPLISHKAVAHIYFRSANSYPFILLIINTDFLNETCRMVLFSSSYFLESYLYYIVPCKWVFTCGNLTLNLHFSGPLLRLSTLSMIWVGLAGNLGSFIVPFSKLWK